jgi:hypothetical protein
MVFDMVIEFDLIEAIEAEKLLRIIRISSLRGAT